MLPHGGPLPTASSTREAKASVAEADMLGQLDLPFPTGINPDSVSRVVLQLFIRLPSKAPKSHSPQNREPGDTPRGTKSLLLAAADVAFRDRFRRRDGHTWACSRPWGGAHRWKIGSRPAAELRVSPWRGGEPSSPLPLDGLGEPAPAPPPPPPGPGRRGTVRFPPAKPVQKGRWGPGRSRFHRR